MTMRCKTILAIILTFVLRGKTIFAQDARATTAAPASDVTLHCEIVDNLCYLQSRLNSSPPGWFVLDSGSSYTVIDTLKAAEFGFKPTGSGTAEGGASGGDNTFGLLEGVTITTGENRLDNQTVVSLPFQYVAQRVGHPTDGTLGSNLFLNQLVGIDYVKKLVFLGRFDAWKAEDRGEAIPITLEGNVPYVQAKVTLPNGQPVEGKFLVDLGQIVAGLLISESFQRAHPEILKHAPLVHPPRIAAVGGTMEYSAGRVPQLQLGSFKVSEPIVCFPEGAVGVYAKPDLAGAIGADILSRFDVVFDYTRSRMFLKPNADFDKPFQADASGLQVGVKPPAYTRFEVVGIMQSSPASKAGLQVGDLIVAINDRKAESLTLSEVQALFRRAGEPCHLLIQRNGREIPVDLDLHSVL